MAPQLDIAVVRSACERRVHNRFLMDRLRYYHKPWKVSSSADFGIDPDAKEAIAFAVLAYESFNRRPANVPSATGARKAVVLGKGIPWMSRW